MPTNVDLFVVTPSDNPRVRRPPPKKLSSFVVDAEGDAANAAVRKYVAGMGAYSLRSVNWTDDPSKEDDAGKKLIAYIVRKGS